MSGCKLPITLQSQPCMHTLILTQGDSVPACFPLLQPIRELANLTKAG